jgi:hypothetical protein
MLPARFSPLMMILPRRLPVSQIWPDIPELEGIPDVLRSGIWTKAYLLAMRSRKTWVLGLTVLSGLASICGYLGYHVAGVVGASLGAIAGSAIGVAFFVRVIIEWRARRFVPKVRAELGWPVGADPIGTNKPKSGEVGPTSQ